MSTDTDTTATPTSTTDAPKSRFIIAFKGVKRVFIQWPDVADYDVSTEYFNRRIGSERNIGFIRYTKSVLSGD